MEYEVIKKSFIEKIESALNKFEKTSENKDVYALAFDCDTSIGQISLRFSNEEDFKEMEKDFTKYESLYKPYGRYGLFGMKYSVGDFKFIDWDNEGNIGDFLDSYYYHRIGDFYGDGEIIQEIIMDGKIYNEEKLKSHIEEIFIRIITETIEYIKKNNSINKTKDFLVFMCDHDISNEDFKKWVLKTNDSILVEKLASITD